MEKVRILKSSRSSKEISNVERTRLAGERGMVELTKCSRSRTPLPSPHYFPHQSSLLSVKPPTSASFVRITYVRTHVYVWCMYIYKYVHHMHFGTKQRFYLHFFPPKIENSFRRELHLIFSNLPEGERLTKGEVCGELRQRFITIPT